MRLIRRLASIVDWIFHRQQAERALDDELQAFVEISAAEKIRDGLPPDEARRLARLELGGVEQVREQVRTYRHGGWLDEFGRDVRYAFRMFVKNPGFTSVVVVTLALGIGANTAIFSLIDALMLRWLPVRNPQELVQVAFQPPSPKDSPGTSFSYAIVRGLAGEREIFVGVAGFSGFTFDVGSRESVSRAHGALVTGGYYDTLGLQPAAGRLLAPDDDQPGAPLVAVISDGYWERQYARGAAALGQTIQINGLPVIIVGVSPRAFTGANVGSIADITMAVAALPQIDAGAAPLLGPGNFWLRILARPQPGLSVSQATARLNAVWPGMSEQVIAAHWPASRRQAMAESVFQLLPGGTGWSYLRSIYRKPLLVLMAVVGLVLLIACANVASLLLARASARQKEMAVRLALGAGRGRIVRQLLIESTLLSLVGAVCGIGLAGVAGRLLVGLISNDANQLVFDLTPNWHILAFTSGVAMVTGIVFGLAPAMQATAVGPFATLKLKMEDARTTSSRSKLLPSLVIAQVALSLILISGAGLFVRTLQNLQSLDPGFSPEGVLLVDSEGRRTPLPRDVLENVQRLPGVLSASLSTHTPLSGSVWSEPAVPAGQPVPEKDNAFFVGAGPGFFPTLGIRLVAGREFTDRDSANSAPVAIVNEVFAARHFGNQTPVGQHLSASVRGRRTDLEIVGIARNTNAAGLRVAPPATVYVAYAQLQGDFPTTLAVRVSGLPGQAASAIQRTLQSAMPEALIDVRLLSRQVEATLVQERMMATLASGFGLLALTLTSVGLYGLLAYSVAQRTREIGIRMALGAQGTKVVVMVLRSGARLVIIGIALGLPAAWAASRSIGSMLFGLTPTDPATTTGAIIALAAVGQLAAYLPARRASRVDPLVALRHE
jgi:putative ABC transport system permease protein